MGAYPPMGTPSPPYPPLLYVRLSVRGDNPLNNDFKIFGKKCSLFPLPNRGVFYLSAPPKDLSTLPNLNKSTTS